MKTEQVRKEHDDMAQTCDAWGHVVETHMILMSKVDDRPPNYRCPVCGEIVDACPSERDHVQGHMQETVNQTMCPTGRGSLS